jgi:hypothetical protein
MRSRASSASVVPGDAIEQGGQALGLLQAHRQHHLVHHHLVHRTLAMVGFGLRHRLMKSSVLC